MSLSILLIRFGSFEIFHPVDDFTGRQGPSVGRPDIRAQLLDYVIETFHPEIERNERKGMLPSSERLGVIIELKSVQCCFSSVQ